MAGGQYAHPGSTEQLMAYWAHGEGAAKIGWGSSGDFDRCRLHLAKYVRPDEVDGLCSNLHVKATGARPGHAAGESAGHHRSERMAKYSAEERRQMASKGQAMSDGSYPIADTDDLQNAIHAVGRGNAGHDGIRKHIISRARALGKSKMIPDSWNPDGSLKSGDDTSSRSETLYTRSFPLEDISIKPGDGRTVEAYATVFNIPSPVRDQDGDYEEIIDPAAFNRALEHAKRAKGGWNIPVLFNHGMTIWQTPSERHSVPIGVPEEIHADSRGLFTRTKYHKTPLADEVLEAIKDGSITGYSFSGMFKQSNPRVPRGGFRSDRGSRTTVRRMESTLREFGPATFRVHDGAEVVGVRAEQAAMLLGNLAPGEFDRLINIFRSGTPLDPSYDTPADQPELGTPSDDGPAPDDPPAGHSTRSPKQELQAARARFLIRHGGN